MSDTQHPEGPSHETLANLKAMLPSFIKGLRKRKVIGKGKAPSVMRPRKVCKVCGLLFDKIMMSPEAEQEIVPMLCETCGSMLQDGYTALVYGEDYAIVKSVDLSDWAGKIVHVSQRVMEAIKKEDIARKRINGDTQRPVEPTGTA